MKAKLILMALASALILVSCEKEYSNREELDVISSTGEVCPVRFELMEKADSPIKTMKVTNGRSKKEIKITIKYRGNMNERNTGISIAANKEFDSCEIEGIISVQSIVGENIETGVLYTWGDVPQHYYEDGVYYIQ